MLKLFTFLTILSLTISTWASHAVGIDLSYSCLGGNQYEVTIQFYRDCDGITPAASLPINISSASCNINFTSSLSQVSVQEVSQICNSQLPNTTCNGGSLPGIEQYTYTGIITLPQQCTDWVISHSTCCRNSGIDNLQSPSSQNIYVEATLDNTGTNCNSSPAFNSLPTPYLCVGQTFSYNNSAVDPDGNTLVYSLIDPLTSAGNNIPHASGYSATNPLAVTGTFNFNTTTGQMDFTPSQVQQGVITILVEEYDNSGNLIGTTMRDLQVVVINCSNSAASATGVDGSNNFTYTVCTGVPFCFDIFTSDPDASDVTTISWNSGISGGSFTSSGTPNATGTFCWTPTTNDVGSHYFTATVEDDACPITSINTYTYQIDVTLSTDPPVNAGNDQTICSGETANLNATAGAGAVISWSPSTGLSCTNCPNPTFNGTSSQIYTATATYPSGCAQTDQVEIIVENSPSVNIFPGSVTLCAGSSATLNATSSAGATLVWTPGGATTPSITVSPAATTTYQVVATNASGCTDTAFADVIMSPPPPTEVCNNIYVTPTGNGTGDAPTDPTDLASALLMSQCNNATIKLAIGTYTIDNAITDILGYTTLEGGYDPTNNWTKTSLPGATTIFRSNLNPEGPANAERLVAIYMNNASYFRFQDLTIEVANAPATGTSAMSTYGVHMTSCSDYDFVRCQIIAGNAMNGVDGTNGAVGVNGANGANGQAGDGDDQDDGGGGGNGGNGGGAGNGLGGAGGACCSVNAFNGSPGDGAGNAQAGNGGGGGASGGGEDRDGGTGGGGAGALGNGGSAGQESGCNGSTISCGASESGNAGQAGANGVNGTSGTIAAPGSNGTGFWVPGGTGTDGTAGNGGAGGGGGGGGAGEGGFFCTDGKGSGGGGGGGGGQGGFPGTGGSSGGSSYAIYTYLNGANGNFVQSNLSAGNAGAGGNGGNGGAGGNGGNGGLGSTYNSEVGCGGNGGAGGNGGNGGNGGDGRPGESNALYQDGTPVAQSDVNFNLAAQPVIFVENKSCTNVDVNFSSGASATWGLGATSTPTSPTGANVLTQYTGVGRKDISYGADLYAGFSNITLNGASDPEIESSALEIAVDTFVVCIGESADFFTNSPNFVEFSWDFGGALVPNNYTNANLTGLTFNTPGTFLIQLEGRTDCCGWSNPDTVYLIVDDVPTLALTGNQMICENESTVLTATSNSDSLIWSPSFGLNPDTGMVVTANPNASTNYAVTAFSTYRLCSTTELIMVTVNPLPDITMSANDQSCTNDGSATATVNNITNPMSYSWDDPNNQTTSTASNLFSGNYEVIVTDNVTGCSDSASIFVGLGTAPFVYISNTTDVLCYNDATGSATAEVSNGTAPYNYVFTDATNGNVIFTDNAVLTSTISNLSAGSYDVTITDANGCSNVTNFGIGQPDSLYILDTVIVNATCYATQDGSIQITADGGAGGYTYQWGANANNSTLDSIGGLNPDFYTITIADLNGCTYTDSIELDIDNSQLNTDAGLNDTICGSEYILQAVPTVGNATGNWLNNLTTGPGTATITNLTDPNSSVDVGNDYGAYSFYWTEDNGLGCPDTAQVEIFFIQPPTVTFNSEDTICSFQTTLSNSSSASSFLWNTLNGSGNLTYSSNTILNPDITVDASGIYDLELITTEQSCERRDTISLYFSDPSFSQNIVDDECNASVGEIEITNVTGAILPYQYSIDNGTSYQGNNLFTNLSAGNYDVVVLDNYACADTVQVTISNNGTLAVNDTTLTHPTCFQSTDGIIEVTATSTAPPIQYQIDNNGYQASNIFNSLGNGVYEIVVSDNNGCTDTLDITLVEPDSITFDTLSIQPLCFGENTGTIEINNVLGGNGNYQYSIDNGANYSNTNLFNTVIAGNYDIVVQDLNGCSSNLNLVLNEPPALSLNISIDSASCFGVSDGVITATVTGGTPTYSYNWNGLAMNNQFQATGVAAGTYNLTITDDNGCIIDNLGYEVLEPNPVIIGQVTVTDVSCYGGNDGSVTLLNPDLTSFSLDNISFQASNVVNGLTASTHTIYATDNNGCAGDTTITIGSPTEIFVTTLASPDTICYGSQSTISASAQGGSGTLDISWDQGLPPNTPINNVSPVNTTIYNVTVTDENGCVNGDFQIVYVLDPISVVAFADATICEGESINISSFASGGDANNVQSNYIFNWSNGVNTPGQIVAPVTDSAFTVYAEDGCGSFSDTASVTITVNPAPDLTLEIVNPEGCLPHTVTFINNSPNSVNCLLNTGDGSVINQCDTVEYTYNYEGLFNIDYTITDANGCSSTVSYVDTVITHSNPEAIYTYSPEEPNLIQNEISFYNNSIDGDTYWWTFSPNVIPANSSEENPIINFPNDAEGSYEVCLITENQYGCTDTVCDSLIINEDFSLFVPNSFTPNNDGINDLFGPVILGVETGDYNFLIFNRWGQLIFETDDINEFWDGRYLNSNCQQDTYVWKINLLKDNTTDRPSSYTGHVNLIR